MISRAIARKINQMVYGFFRRLAEMQAFFYFCKNKAVSSIPSLYSPHHAK